MDTKDLLEIIIPIISALAGFITRYLRKRAENEKKPFPYTPKPDKAK